MRPSRRAVLAAFALAAPIFLGAMVAARAEDALQRHVFLLDDRPYAVLLPPSAVLTASPWSEAISVVFEPGARSSRTLRVSLPRSRDLSGYWDERADFADDRRVDYKLDSAEGGSGGLEAYLDGDLFIGEAKFAVGCAVQGEHIAIDAARWCLDVLKTMERARPSAD